ncbi:MAG: alpha/beta fold hydrolase [Leadbetterella sp.]
MKIISKTPKLHSEYSKVMIWGIYVLLLCGQTSCFRKYINTERELRKHYDTLSFKPKYSKIKGEHLQLYVAAFGSDTLPPIIYIHGAPGRWDGYQKQLDDTSYHKKYFSIGLDRPGYGKSYHKRKHRALSIQKQAEMISLALKLCKSTEKPILVSRSYGCPVAAYMIAKNPDTYKKLILMSPAIDPEAERFFWFSKFGKWWIIRWFLPKRLNTATDEKYAHVKELKKIDSVWAKINIPTTVIYGGRDWVVGKENFEFAKRKLGERAKYIYLPDAGHRISRSHSEILKKVIQEDIELPLN